MAWYSQYLVMIHKSFHRIVGKNSSVSSSGETSALLELAGGRIGYAGAGLGFGSGKDFAAVALAGKESN